MTYEEFKKELSQIELTRDLVKCGYISYLDKENELHKLNPLFSNSHKVNSISWHMNGKDFTFRIVLCGYDYRDISLYECDYRKLHELTEKQRDAIVAYVKEWHTKKLAEIAERIERGKQEISIEDLQKECERVANELLTNKTTKYGNKLRAVLSVGKRGCDNLSEPYTALCIEYYGNVFGNVGWHYYGGITFFKDKYGINHMKEFRPLCGECSGEFSWDWFKEDVLSYAA